MFVNINKLKQLTASKAAIKHANRDRMLGKERLYEDSMSEVYATTN